MKNPLDKARLNKKVVLGAMALLCCVGIIALCSFFPFIIDPSQWQTMEFLSNEIMVSAISIFSVMCLVFMAQASNAQNPKSNIARAKVKFLGNGGDNEGSVNRIIRHDLISAFSQWVKGVLQPNDIKTAKERILVHCGIDDVHVLDLEKSQLEALMNGAQKYGDRFYHSITKRQYLEIMRAKEMKFVLVDPSYYLTCEKYASDKTITEQSAMENKKKATLLTYSIVSKIVMSVVISMIFSSLIYDSATGVPVAKAWLSFMTKLFSMFTSAFLGYNVGCQINDIDAYYINLKCSAHDRFIEDKDFKAKSQQELAKEEFKERVKKETSNLMIENKGR